MQLYLLFSLMNAQVYVNMDNIGQSIHKGKNKVA